MKRLRITAKPIRDISNSSMLGKWLPALVWASLIFAFSSIGSIKVTELFFWDFLLKKSAHITEYAILYLLLLRATGKRWHIAYILCFIYAISDEFHQSFVPGRTATILDLGFDLSGANIASYIIWKYYQNHLGKLKK